MYAWLWHRLPGRTPARVGVLALIILRHGGPMVLRLPLGLASPADRLLRLQRLRFKIPVLLVGVSLGVTLGEPVSDGGALADAPF